MVQSRVAAFVVAAVATFYAVGPASAQPSDAEIAAARALGKKGVVAAQAGRCDEAIDNLTRAKKLLSAPTILVPLGECQIKVGRIVAGTENLQAALRAELPANPPDAFVKALDRARELLPQGLAALAKLTVLVTVPAGVELALTDNGDKLPGVLIGAERPVDPGKHVITVAAPGYREARGEIELASGASATLPLTLEPLPVVAPPPPPPVVPPPATGPAPMAVPVPGTRSGPDGLFIGGGIGMAFGAVGLGLGIGFGVHAMQRRKDLDELCLSQSDGKHCPPGTQSDIDALTRAANVSTAGFVVGGAGLGLGAILLGIGASAAPASAGEVSLDVGPAWLGARGAFE